jgi:hypothetical protein
MCFNLVLFFKKINGGIMKDIRQKLDEGVLTKKEFTEAKKKYL